ncbi:MAG: hypothetical protein ACK2UW_21300, partial [Anaerolineales bacterium]
MPRKWLNVFVWGICALIGLATIYGLSNVLSSRPTDDNLFRLTNEVLWAAGPLIIALLAALIITRQPGNSIGWLLLIMASSLPLSMAIDRYLGSFGANAPPPTLLNLTLTMFYGISWLPLIFPLVLIVLLFPTGKPPSPRWKWLAAAILMLFFTFIFIATFAKEYPDINNNLWTLLNPIGFIDLQTLEAIVLPWQIGLGIVTVLSLVSLFVRYRTANAIERTQIKWVLYACGIFVTVYVPGLLTSISDSHGLANDIFNLVLILAILAIPAAIVVAILRYRLWDIDLIIRRTLLYGALTGLLALVFFGLVIVLQQILGGVTQSENSPLAIVLSTLAIA